MVDLPSTPQYSLDPSPPAGLAGKRRLVILIALVVVIAAGGAIALWLTRSKPTPQNANAVVVNRPPSAVETNQPLQRFPADIRADQDGDGLSDAKERQAQTNPALADSDGDGLTDAEEVNVYKSSPLKQDTDGDGQTDKQEVVAGRNPIGPGLLRDLPAAIKSLTNN